MNGKKVFQRLEIFFWNTVIALLSESAAARAVLLETYSLVKPQSLFKTLAQGAVLALAGLAVGFILGYVRTMLQ